MGMVTMPTDGERRRAVFAATSLVVALISPRLLGGWLAQGDARAGR
jgi:hypothetical protein